MTPAARSLAPPGRRLGGAAATLVVCLGLVACGGPAEPGLAPSTPSSPAVSAGTPGPTPEQTPSADTADRVVVDNTNADDEIHAHTDDAAGYELEVKAGVPTTGRFTLGSAGSFEVESHHLEKIIVILNVR